MTETFGAAAARLSRAASLLLGWRPGEFWGATPAELALAVGADAADGTAPDKATLDALRMRFPDDREGSIDG